MKTVWILCILMTTHGCFHLKESGKIRVYETEIQCVKAMNKYQKEARENGEEVWFSQCESTDAMMEEQKNNNE